MDNLEKFIIENREEFDSELPGLNVWAGIQDKIEITPKVKLFTVRRLSAAAAIVLLFIAGGVIGSQLTKSNSRKSLSDISPEYAEMENYFNRQVQNKLTVLAKFNKSGVVQQDIHDLDRIYEELQKELQEIPIGKEEQIIEAMINTYQTKIEILEHVLQKVQNSNPTNSKTAENEIKI
jgi:hypothetical protein